MPPSHTPGPSADAALAAHTLELLAPLGTVRSRRMFGGHGFYVDELFIALIAGGQLYLKTDDDSRERFVAAGSAPFVFHEPTRGAVTTSYWRAPDDALDSAAAMADWARLAIAAAVRAKGRTRARRGVTQPAGKAPARAASAATKPAAPPATARRGTGGRAPRRAR